MRDIGREHPTAGVSRCAADRRKVTRSYLSLFAGCGGLDIGFEQEGFEVSLALDKRASAIASFNANRRAQNGHVGDVAALTADDLDNLFGDRFAPAGVIGGPPCQSFSRGNRSRSPQDSRTGLVIVFVEQALGLHRRTPLDFIVMENVPELITYDEGRLFRNVKGRLRRAGFSVRELLLNSENFSVAQRRKRLFLIAIRSDALRSWADITSYESPPKCVKDAIGHLARPVRFEEHLTLQTVMQHPNHWCMTPRSEKFSTGLLQPGTSFGRSFKTLQWDKPSPTVSFGHREVHIHPCGHRRLSVFESMLLQGFPEDYVLKGTISDQFSQVSEAVPPPLARAIARVVQTSLNSDD